MPLLLAFDASAKHLSFTRASGELSLNPSVVSRQVQNLEELLGAQLFIRDGRSLVLSETGLAYHDEVSQALDQIRDASLQVTSRGGADGEIHVAVYETVASKWLMTRIGRFYAQHRRTLVHLHTMAETWDPATRRIDVVIANGVSGLSGTRAYHLMDEIVWPVVAPQLKEELHCPADVRKLLLLRQKGFSRSDLWHRWFLQQQLDPAEMKLGPSFELGMHLIQAVATGIGIGLLPKFLLKEEFDTAAVCPAFDAPMQTGYAFYLYVPKTNVDRGPVAAFTEWILGEMRVDTL